MRKLKAGIVGCGGIANGKHLPAMKKSGLYEIVAFCDIIRERAEKAKKEYGTEDAKVFEDYQELIKEDLDVVYVTTPNRSHAEISIAAMEAGKDVMCENEKEIEFKRWILYKEDACNSFNLTEEELTVNYNATIAYHDILGNDGNAGNNNTGGSDIDEME